jgi:hypothetical protein
MALPDGHCDISAVCSVLDWLFLSVAVHVGCLVLALVMMKGSSLTFRCPGIEGIKVLTYGFPDTLLHSTPLIHT